MPVVNINVVLNTVVSAKMECSDHELGINLIVMLIRWSLSKADTIGTNKIVHYREGVLWSGVYYTLCGLYLGFSKCPLWRGCPLERGVR